VPIEFLSEEQVLLLNRAYVLSTGEHHALINPDGLASALGRPQTGRDGQYFYDSIHKMATALTESIACNHPFESGNKRTAFMAMEIFLHRNGHVLIASDYEKIQFMLDLVNHTLNFDSAATWIEDHCHCIDPASVNMSTSDI